MKEAPYFSYQLWLAYCPVSSDRAQRPLQDHARWRWPGQQANSGARLLVCYWGSGLVAAGILQDKANLQL